MSSIGERGRRVSKWLRRALLLIAGLTFLIALVWAVLSTRPARAAAVAHRRAAGRERSRRNRRAVHAGRLPSPRGRDAARRPRSDRGANPEALQTPANRYFSGSRLNPRQLSRDWNRTFEVVPERSAAARCSFMACRTGLTACGTWHACSRRRASTHWRSACRDTARCLPAWLAPMRRTGQPQCGWACVTFVSASAPASRSCWSAIRTAARSSCTTRSTP